MQGVTDGKRYVDDNHPDAYNWERFCLPAAVLWLAVGEALPLEGASPWP
ncbi:MAG: hypothetical protein HFF69_10505 [Oscillospiraceae bacterium]|nr:hypothetical protein [Oscillospiraceae bacterium]